MSDIDRSEVIEYAKEKRHELIEFWEDYKHENREVKYYDFIINSLETDEAYQLEYESTTKNDCETCIHNKGVLECDMYGCKYEPTTKSETLISLEVYKQVAWERDIAIEQLHELGYEFGEKIKPTTKKNLVVDAISRADARSLICKIDIKHHLSGMTRKVFKDLYNGIDELTSVTPQEPLKTIYVLFKNEEYKIFDTEKEACEFLGVKQSSVAGAWRDRGKCKGWNVIRIGNKADMRGEEV